MALARAGRVSPVLEPPQTAAAIDAHSLLRDAEQRAAGYGTLVSNVPGMTAISTRSPVVCATDFSDNAKKAGTVAAALARRMGAPLVLVHAVNLGPSLLVPVAERRTALRVEQVQLQEEVRRLQTGEVAITTVLLEEGWAAEALLGYVGKIAPRCVVLSARRMSALDRWATGSVSDQIAQHAMCPTIVVRDASPFVRWVDGKAPLKIFVALDFGCCTNAVLRWVDEIRQVGPCELTVCHVNWRPEKREFVAAKGAGLNAENTPAEQQSLERDLRKKLRDALGTDEAKIVVKPTWGAPESELIDAADAGGADLMVVGTHQRHGLAWLWHGSVSRALVHHATMNVACVPTSATIDPKRVHVPQFRRVLVATDLSTAGNGAIPLACAAVPPGGVVEVLHVVSPIEAHAGRPDCAGTIEACAGGAGAGRGGEAGYSNRGQCARASIAGQRDRGRSGTVRRGLDLHRCPGKQRVAAGVSRLGG